MTGDRALRLQERFQTIRQTLAELTDPDVAYAACCVGWLEAIEYTVREALLRVRQDPGEITTSVDELHLEIRALLQSFHSELCDHLGLDQTEILKRSTAFKEVVNDICKQRG